MNIYLNPPWKAFLTIVLTIVFLLSMKQLWVSSSPMPILQTPIGSAPTFTLEAPPKLVAGSKLLFHSANTAPEKVLLQRQIGDQYEFVEYNLTGVEYFGYALILGFAIASFWLLFSLVSEDWTRERVRYVCEGKIAVLAALQFGYGLASLLGWVWMSPLPFFLMGGCLFIFACIFRRIPVANSQPWKWRLGPAETSLEVKISEPSKTLKVTPRIGKMFERRDSPEKNQGPKELKDEGKVSIGDALEAIRSPEVGDPAFEACFKNWRDEIKRLKPWDHEVIENRHGICTIRRVAQSLFDGERLRGGTWFLLDMLAEMSGRPEQLISSIHQRLVRWESGH